MTTNAESIAKRAKTAFDESQQRLSLSGREEADKIRSRALERIRSALESSKEEIERANREDVRLAREQVESGKLSNSLVSRLDLFSKPGKWDSMLQGVSDVARLPSPLDVCTYSKRLASSDSVSGDLDLYRLTCPIGVLLCIFEARPEVIVNIASLAIKSGNAAILKGGKESKLTAAVMSRVLSEALAQSELPADLVQTVETREDIAALLHQEKYIDLVIPRGSNELVRSIQREARMPVMGHADGLCIAYVHDDALLDMTIGTIVDSKTDYPAACNSLETLLLHESHLSTEFWPRLAQSLVSAGVTLHCDESSLKVALEKVEVEEGKKERIVPSTSEDYDTEFLDLDLAVKVVKDLDEAIRHINLHSSNHTDVILCSPIVQDDQGSTSEEEQDPSSAASKFTKSISSANIFVNASTRFSDGFRYGFGTEVGISTGRTHARGPVGLEGLVIYKYVVKAKGKGPQTAGAFSLPDGDSKKRKWDHSDIPRKLPRF
ncbi:gamma-glutamyl phosphate reductase GPR [Violaceomyces palustris]|uniref:Gamma-glutamyl phosphate reductase GPR n=1 Tax=Violaceomyces palustris TaxID=1673888 RepID=A0ACD0P314_9BASI|nr:gamma-glutamyl phosphate reductase GPR [Violaceomyces palustris]